MRKYLPTLAELIDRLSIVQLKAIFISENALAYEKEMDLIVHDIDEILSRIGLKPDEDGENSEVITGKMIRAIIVIAISNRFIWENESKARQGGTDQDKLLKLTHSINGVRNTAKNVISKELGERVDLKTDCLAADLVSEFGNWNIPWEESAVKKKKWRVPTQSELQDDWKLIERMLVLLRIRQRTDEEDKELANVREQYHKSWIRKWEAHQPKP